MMLDRYTLAVSFAVLATTISASAATSHWDVRTDNIVPNTVANALTADGEGDDWTGAVLRVDLSAGSVYHDDSGQGGIPSPWPFFLPEREFDTNVGIFDDGTAGIAGGAGGLGGGALSLDAPQISVTWFNTDTSNTGPVQIAMITLSPDATGTWELVTSFTGGQVQTSGTVVNGAIIPEPAALALMGLGGLAVLNRS